MNSDMSTRILTVYPTILVSSTPRVINTSVISCLQSAHLAKLGVQCGIPFEGADYLGNSSAA